MVKSIGVRALFVAASLLPVSPADADVPVPWFFRSDQTVTTVLPPAVQPLGGFWTDGIIGYHNDGKPSDSRGFGSPYVNTIIFVAPGRYDYDVFVYNGSTLQLQAGAAVRGTVHLFDNSTFNLNHGFVLGLENPFTHAGGGTLTAADQSTINITNDNANIFRLLLLSDNSILNMSAGTLSGGLDAEKNSTAIISGGKIDSGSIAAGGSKIQVLGGIINSLKAYNDSALTMTAGILGGLTTFDNVAVNLLGGSVHGTVTIRDHSTATASGANITAAVEARDGGAFTFNSGNLAGALRAGLNGAVIVNGGVITGNVVASHGAVSLNGGTIAGDANAEDHGTLTIAGAFIGGAALATDAAISFNGGHIDASLLAQGHSDILMNSGDVMFFIGSKDTSTFTMTGGAVHGDFAVADGQATMNISGGTISGEINAHGHGTFNLTGGAIGRGVVANGNSTINLNGGTITGDIRANESSTINFAGASSLDGVWATNGFIVVNSGSIGGNLHAQGVGTVSILGGFVKELLTAEGASTVFMNGGQVGLSVFTKGTATVGIASGLIQGDITSQENSTVNFSGGRVDGSLFAHDSSTINLSGGTILGTVSSDGDATVNCSGGNVLAGSALGLAMLSRVSDALTDAPLGPAFVAYDNAKINFYGIDLVATLVDPDAGGIFSQYALTGFFADGTPINNVFFQIQNNSGATFQLLLPVPEPIAATLILPGALLFLIRRERARGIKTVTSRTKGNAHARESGINFIVR